MFVSIVIGIFIYLSTVNIIKTPYPQIISFIVFVVGYYTLSKNEHFGFLDVDTYALRSKIQQVNPLLKLFFSLTVIIIVVSSNNFLLSFFVIISISFLTLRFSDIRLSYYLNLLKVPLFFIALSSIAIMIQIGRHSDLYFNFQLFGSNFFITNSSQREGALLFLKAYGGLVSIYFLGLNTPIGDLISGLKAIKTPEILIELMYLIYRYIMVLFETFSKLNTSATKRMGYTSLKTTLKTSKFLASRLMNYSMLQALENYNALESRLYEGNIRFLERKPQNKKSHYIFVGTYLVFLVLIWKYS